jgi:hypothetical protein
MGFARAIFALIVIVGIGLVGYQIGISQTIATQLPAGAAPVAYYGYPYHFGFGFLGFLFPLFFLFLIFGLLRAAMFGGRGGWAHKGPGYMGRGGWGSSGSPDQERDGWMGGRQRIEALHRELHGEKPGSGGTSSGPSGPAT